MRRKICLYVAGSLMILVGLLRGLGGLLSLTNGIETVSENTVTWKTTVTGSGLLLVALLLIVSTCLLFIKRNKMAWMVSWISICLFIIGGLVNGFLLFGKITLKNDKKTGMAASNLRFSRKRGCRLL
jgi:hypothetical protein